MSFLSKRLQYVAEEIEKADTIADIGADHGKLIVYALKHGIAERAFAVDISEKSLRKAIDLAEATNVSDRVEFLCGDGLIPLKEIPDTIVIAGMGGNEIVKILSDKTVDSRYIFLPHQDAPTLRRYLIGHGFNITKDYIIRDGKFYSIIVAEIGNCAYSESEIILGANRPVRQEFTERLLERKLAIEKIMLSQGVEIENLQDELSEEYKEINKWLESQTL